MYDTLLTDAAHRHSLELVAEDQEVGRLTQGAIGNKNYIYDSWFAPQPSEVDCQGRWGAQLTGSHKSNYQRENVEESLGVAAASALPDLNLRNDLHNEIRNKAGRMSLQSLLEHLRDVLEVVVGQADVDHVVLQLRSFVHRLVGLVQLKLQASILQLLLFVGMA